MSKATQGPDRGGSADVSPYDWLHGDDIVTEASAESFPASDPPSFTPNVSLGPPCPPGCEEAETEPIEVEEWVALVG